MIHRAPLEPGRLVAALGADPLWCGRVRVSEETGSTNQDLLELARRGAPEGSLLIAEHQSAGRGRRSRAWTQPPRSGIALSALLRPAGIPGERLGWLPLLAGVALARALEARAELPATIQVGLKWPNDLLLEERAPRRSSGKVGGILVELTPGAAIVGVGLNVTLTADELPPPPLSDPEATRATSLAIAGAKVLERETLLIALATELSSAYRAWCSANGDPEACGLAAEYTRLCRTVGRSVRAHLPDATQLDGVAHSVDAQGRLVIEHDRTQTPLAAADVVHLR